MNLLSDLSSELAVAILLDKKYAETVNSNDALNLIGKIYEILEPISSEEKIRVFPLQINEAKTIGH